MSGKVNDHTLEEIRARVDIVELIGARITLKKSGGTFKGCCPFHREKTPSFHVNPTRQNYHCFGCGEHGDVFKFLMKQDGMTFPEAVRMLADRTGVVLSQDVDYNAQSRNLLFAIHADLASSYQRFLKTAAEAEIARHYLASRKLPDDVVERFGIGYAPEQPPDNLLQWAKRHDYTPEQLVEAGLLSLPNEPDRPDAFYDRFRGRLMFPICDRQGRVVAFSGRLLKERKNTGKYVNSPETEIFVKSRVLYALDKAASKIVKHPRREAIVCEGQIDVIRCHACGFETAVAAQGTAFTKEHVALLKKHADSVVLVFDGDAAGRKAALRTGALFLEEEIPVRVAVLPVGEDPDSILRDRGPDTFRELLDNALSLIAFQIDTLRQGESQPDTIDAVSRVARSVIETLAACANAVQRAHLLDEAARLLHLPLVALEEDLEKHRAELSRKAAYAAAPAHHEAPPAAASRTTAQPEPAPAPTDDRTAAPHPLDTPPPAPPSRTEYLLCELLVEHEHDPEVLGLVARHLPPELLPHPFARAVVDALARPTGDPADPLAALALSTPPEWQRTLSSLLANKQKMLSAREATGADAAQDLITRLWTLHLKRLRATLDAARSLSLTPLIKRLETLPWDQACLLMTPETAAFGAAPLTPREASRPHAAHARQASADAPSAHAADNASGAADPEEFPPSAYPPDEMPD